MEGGLGLFFEDVVVVLGEGGVVVGGVFFLEFVDVGVVDFFVVFVNFVVVFELVGDVFFFVYEEYYDVDCGLLEMDVEWCMDEFVMELVEFVDEKFEVFDLDFGVGKVVEDDVVVIFGVEELL